MNKQDTISVETIKESIVLERKKIELQKKIQRTPFFVPMPNNAVDMDLTCDVLHPNKFLSSDGNEEVDFIGAIIFRLMEHDDILRNKENQLHQLNLFTDKTVAEGYKYIKQMKFKFIDPSTELYRNRSRPLIEKYLKLDKIPEYLTQHLVELSNVDSNNLDMVHEKFWDIIFTENRAAHFIKWHFNQQNDRKADVFIPPVPLINPKNREILVNKAIEINSDALEIVGESAASHFIIDVQLFRHREAIQKIAEYISYINTKFNIIKILNSNKIVEKGFGQDARDNFELFLRVIKSIKEENPNRVFGIISEGGFGYSLIGAGFDFFVDTVNNYSQNFIRPRGKRSTYRQILNPETLALEPIEGVKNMLKDNGTFLGSNPIIKKYRGRSLIEVDPKIWSEDCRKHGILTWNELTKIAVRSINDGEDTLYFDKIQNSDYAILGNIVRKINL